MKTICITGGAGFIGSNLVNYLFRKYSDYKLIVLDALTYAGNLSNIPREIFDSSRFEFRHGNICNGSFVDSVISECDIILHLAAESHVTRSIYDNTEFFQTDVIGTQFLANAAIRYRSRIERFVHISTSEVYGTAESEKMDENHPLNPKSPYAAAKCGADRLIYSYHRTYGMPAVIIRPFNNYGPNQHLEKVIPRFITSCILGEPLRVHGDGSAARDFFFVEDHCAAIDQVIHAPVSKISGQVFNLGSGVDISVLELAEIIKKTMNSQSQIELIGDRPGQVFRHTCDASRIQKVLGWTPSTEFAEGLRRTIDWYVQNEDWWQSQFWLRHVPIVDAAGRKVMH